MLYASVPLGRAQAIASHHFLTMLFFNCHQKDSSPWCKGQFSVVRLLTDDWLYADGKWGKKNVEASWVFHILLNQKFTNLFFEHYLITDHVMI